MNELRNAVDSRYGIGGQSLRVTVTPEGTVQLPGLGSIAVEGLSLPETKREVDRRYSELVNGMEVTPILIKRAPRYIYVLGEVAKPGRFELVGPTTVMQSIALAGSWNVGAKLREVVIFRRDDNWQLMATRVGLLKPLYGHSPCPPGELWLRDSDIVLVPKNEILIGNEIVDQIFTRGLYGVVPTRFNIQFLKQSTL